jgi:glucosamine kinase
MFVVADMGSTKTDWSFVDEKKKTSLKTQGFNPYFYSTENIKQILKDAFDNKNLPLTEVEKLYFYGSGCSTDEKCAIIKNALIDFFPNTEIFITHDLLGSARALCGRNQGVACILGTGSNSCLYDGENIIDNVPSLGFLLGDEGGGSDIGRELIKYYNYGELPMELEEQFEEEFKMNRKLLLKEVYETKHPNVYCAGYSKFVADNKANPVMQQLITERLDEFFKRHVIKYEDYKNLPINFIGSTAYYYSDILRKVAIKYGTRVGVIVQNPMEKLIAFHNGL